MRRTVFAALLLPAMVASVARGVELRTGQTTDRQQGEALDWLDRYQTVQVLFKQEDFQKLRAEVAGMSPDEVHSWWQQTAEIRTLLESESWRETRRWLRECVALQMIFSKEEIEDLRERSGGASPREWYELILEIQKKHEAMRGMLAAAERQRQVRLAFRKSQLQRQEAARRTASSLARSYANRPMFAPGQSHPVRRHYASRYRVPPPLITSREVARWTVHREIFGRHGRRW